MSTRLVFWEFPIPCRFCEWSYLRVLITQSFILWHYPVHFLNDYDQCMACGLPNRQAHASIGGWKLANGPSHRNFGSHKRIVVSQNHNDLSHFKSSCYPLSKLSGTKDDKIHHNERNKVMVLKKLQLILISTWYPGNMIFETATIHYNPSSSLCQKRISNHLPP